MIITQEKIVKLSEDDLRTAVSLFIANEAKYGDLAIDDIIKSMSFIRNGEGETVASVLVIADPDYDPT